YPESMLVESALNPDEWRDLKMYEGAGCFECGGTGFRGRTAIHELLDLSDRIREMILDKRSTAEIKRVARDEGMTFLREAAVRRLAPTNGKRREAALILPDYCARVAVLDFDSFPADPKEQLSLVRFRLKKSVPFDVDSAAVGYWAQPAAGGKQDVVAAVAP